MNISDLVAESGTGFRTTSSGKELLLECSFCQREKLYLNARSGLWICQRCGESGNLWRLAREVLGMNPSDAVIAIRQVERDGDKEIIRSSPHDDVDNRLTSIDLPPGFTPLTEPTNRIQHQFWAYLRARTNLPDDLIRAYGMGYTLVPSIYSWRVIVPVKLDGELRTFVARSLWQECKRCGRDSCICQQRWVKVVYPPGPKVSHILFNLDRMKQGEEIVLTEGVFDALALPDKAVATFGTHLSPEQRSLLAARTRRVCIAWDGDEAGRLGARRVAQELASDLFHVRVAYLPDGEDPNSLPPGDLHRIIESAEEISLLSAGRA